jgi:hypothetical protein
MMPKLGSRFDRKFEEVVLEIRFTEQEYDDLCGNPEKMALFFEDCAARMRGGKDPICGKSLSDGKDASITPSKGPIDNYIGKDGNSIPF